MGKTFEENFDDIKQHATGVRTDCMTNITDFAFQFEIMGEGSGIFYIEYKDHVLNIEPYNYYDYAARIQASAEIMIELISGQITINDAIHFDDVNIISNADSGVKMAMSFFDACCNSRKSSDFHAVNQSPNVVLGSTSPWENLRVYIEQADIDEESKKQLLTNLVKFTNKELHILIVGACGCGKSSTVNALFNMEMAQVGYGVEPETQEVSVYQLDNLYLHDSPGLGESTEKDKEHIKKIKASLQEKDADGNAVIDVVLVIVDGSHRDMKSSFELINDVVIPNLQHKDRILIGINRCDLALNGHGWVGRYNYPNEELLQRLEEKSESVRKRIKNDTGVDVEPVFYSALHKYNISKLLSYLVKSVPAGKRSFFVEKINKDPDNFSRDDTATLVKKNANKDKTKKSRKNSNNTHSNSESYELYKEITDIKSTIIGIERKIDTIASSKQDDETEYDLITTNKRCYGQDFQDSMDEAFAVASAEINKGSKEKIRLSFENVLCNMKQCAKAGAELGEEIGQNVPVIGAVVGKAAGAIIGGIGGLITSIVKRR